MKMVLRGVKEISLKSLLWLFFLLFIVKTDDNIVRAYVSKKLYHPGIMDCHECKNPEGEDYAMVKKYECGNLEDDPV